MGVDGFGAVLDFEEGGGAYHGGVVGGEGWVWKENLAITLWIQILRVRFRGFFIFITAKLWQVVRPSL